RVGGGGRLARLSPRRRGAGQRGGLGRGTRATYRDGGPLAEWRNGRRARLHHRSVIGAAKSGVRKGVWVRVPPRPLIAVVLRGAPYRPSETQAESRARRRYNARGQSARLPRRRYVDRS